MHIKIKSKKPPKTQEEQDAQLEAYLEYRRRQNAIKPNEMQAPIEAMYTFEWDPESRTYRRVYIVLS